jgi:predicted dehydrogenase
VSGRPFRVAFIGSGLIAQHHMKLLKNLENVQIVAASDINEKALAKAKELYGVPKLYTDYQKMLKEVKEIDAVDVCTPNGQHATNCIAAFAAGHHVMVEKPMAMNAVEGRAMLEAAKKAGKQLVVGFQYRFDPKSKLIKDQIDAGAIGRIMYVRAQALRRRGIPNWGVFGRKDLQGGGPMIDIGVHILEMAHYIIGSPRPVTVSGNTWTYSGNQPCNVACQWPNWDHKTYTVEDLAAGLIRFDTGALLTIEASFVAHIEKDVWNIQIMGEKGGANWDASQIFVDQGGYMMNMTPGFLPQKDNFESKMKHFVEVCQGLRPNESSGEQGLMVQKMLDGIYASADAGREVTVE